VTRIPWRLHSIIAAYTVSGASCSQFQDAPRLGELGHTAVIGKRPISSRSSNRKITSCDGHTTAIQEYGHSAHLGSQRLITPGIQAARAGMTSAGLRARAQTTSPVSRAHTSATRTSDSPSSLDGLAQVVGACGGGWLRAGVRLRAGVLHLPSGTRRRRVRRSLHLAVVVLRECPRAKPRAPGRAGLRRVHHLYAGTALRPDHSARFLSADKTSAIVIGVGIVYHIAYLHRKIRRGEAGRHLLEAKDAMDTSLPEPEQSGA
jgi:hypothetical protein